MTGKGLAGRLPLLGNIGGKKRYEAAVAPSGRLLVNFNGLQAGCILDKNYFEPGWFTDSELEILAKIEASTQIALKGSDTRIYSGLYPYSHSDRVVENLFGLAKDAGVRLDFITVGLAIIHDRTEDNQEIKTMQHEWERALAEQEYTRASEISPSLVQKRLQLRDADKSEFLGYLHEARGISNDERGALGRTIETMVLLASDLSRDSTARSYTLSMNHQYSRVREESLEDTLTRMLIKNEDRRASLREYQPIPAETMLQLKAAFKDSASVGGHIVGEELQRRFGRMGNGRRMANAVMVQTAFKSLPPLQYQNETLNSYEADIEKGAYGEKAKQLLALVKLSHAGLIQDSLALLREAIASYERDRHIQRIKPHIDKEIKANRAGEYYRQAELGGPLEYWLLTEQRERSVLESLDSDPLQRGKVYATARHLFELIPNYGMWHAPDGEPNKLPALLSNGDPMLRKRFTLHRWDALVSLIPGVPRLMGSSGGGGGSVSFLF